MGHIDRPPYVVDASAVIALLRDEPGAAEVERALAAVDTTDPTAALISTVNLAEVHQALGPELPASLIGEVDSVIRPAAFSATHARGAAALREPTRDLGLSLADRACLALARSLDLTVLTADRPWARADVGVEIRLIR
ncbi:MAG: type II toxin-antitoxin system VapC family toxin [Solirubrobacteraceae bacterium]|nr:type II toxin-antitoxin system VapC family toxin [Solirubrobacteraceae bacterium]